PVRRLHRPAAGPCRPDREGSPGDRPPAQDRQDPDGLGAAGRRARRAGRADEAGGRCRNRPDSWGGDPVQRGGELVQILEFVMRAGAPYTLLKGAVYIHPTLAEGFWWLMEEVKPVD